MNLNSLGGGLGPLVGHNVGHHGHPHLSIEVHFHWNEVWKCKGKSLIFGQRSIITVYLQFNQTK